MRGSEHFLDKPPAELTEFLLQVARAEVAPQAARERALQNVASAALGLGVLAGTAALGSRSTLLKGTSWLVAKWLAAGMSTGLLGIAVAQGVEQLATKPAGQPALHAPSATATVPARRAARSLPSPTLDLPPPVAVPERSPVFEVAAAKTPAPAASFPATGAGLPGIALAREPSTPARASSDRASSDRAPGERAPSPAPSASSIGSLTRELTLLERARGALTQHSANHALQALDEYRREFPHGSMQVEAAALRIEAVGQSGDHGLAQRLAQAFLTNFPNSPLAGRVRAFAEVSGAGSGQQNP